MDEVEEEEQQEDPYEVTSQRSSVTLRVLEHLRTKNWTGVTLCCYMHINFVPTGEVQLAPLVFPFAPLDRTRPSAPLRQEDAQLRIEEDEYHPPAGEYIPPCVPSVHWAERNPRGD